MLEAYVLCVAVHDRAGFNKKKLSQKWGKLAKNRVFRIYWEFSHYFFQNLVSKESLYYLSYYCTNPILGKNLVPQIWAKMLLANQIAGFLNWLYLQNTKMKKPDEKAWGKNLKLVEKYWVSMVKNGCGNSGLRTLKLAVSQKGINRINWFLVCW